MVDTYTGKTASTTRIVLAVLFAVGCSTSSYNTDEAATAELNMEKSRQIAEDFVRSHPDFVANNGKDLTLIAEEALRCRLCWAFDFRYVVLVNGIPRQKYITVTVQEGKASMAIPVQEGMPSGQ
ncbi:MAG: hypothetical protein ACFFCW_22215 [Candidatus Hodarchaeota archaeon]